MIYPTQLLPDVGGRYRHRETGEVRELTYVSPDRRYAVCFLDLRGVDRMFVMLEDLWRDWIHADAGAAG